MLPFFSINIMKKKKKTKKKEEEEEEEKPAPDGKQQIPTGKVFLSSVVRTFHRRVPAVRRYFFFRGVPKSMGVACSFTTTVQ